MLELHLVACHPYESNDPRHLKFPAGACISAKPGQEGNPLWLGRFAGKQGWFPPSYCRIQPWSPIIKQRQALRTRSLDDYDFSRGVHCDRPCVIERRCRSIQEEVTCTKKSAPIKELFVPKTPKAETFLRESKIFSKVDQFVEELGQSSSELSLPELPSLSTTRRRANTAHGHVAGVTNKGISDSCQDSASFRASPTVRRSSPRRSKSTGGSWMQGLKDIRNIMSPRKTKKLVQKTSTNDVENGIAKIHSGSKPYKPQKDTSIDRWALPMPLKVGEPVDPIEVLAAEFRAREALTPL